METDVATLASSSQDTLVQATLVHPFEVTHSWLVQRLETTPTQFQETAEAAHVSLKQGIYVLELEQDLAHWPAEMESF